VAAISFYPTLTNGYYGSYQAYDFNVVQYVEVPVYDERVKFYRFGASENCHKYIPAPSSLRAFRRIVVEMPQSHDAPRVCRFSSGRREVKPIRSRPGASSLDR
jgi:hypothetical protein